MVTASGKIMAYQRQFSAAIRKACPRSLMNSSQEQSKSVEPAKGSVSPKLVYIVSCAIICGGTVLFHLSTLQGCVISLMALLILGQYLLDQASARKKRLAQAMIGLMEGDWRHYVFGMGLGTYPRLYYLYANSPSVIISKFMTGMA